MTSLPASIWWDQWLPVIQQIHLVGHPGVLVLNGGALALSAITMVPGASSWLIEGVVPYHINALGSWLGKSPEHACSAATSLSMAAAACQKGRELSPVDSVPPLASGGSQEQIVRFRSIFGLGATASLVSSRPKKGPHRCHVACHSSHATTLRSLVLNKGKRDRLEEETVVASLILSTLADEIGVPHPGLGLYQDEQVLTEQLIADPIVREVWEGARGFAVSHPSGVWASETGSKFSGILPGAFNPLHEGHLRLMEVTEELLGGAVLPEISIENVDKPPLDYLTLESRRKQFNTRPLLVTRAATFLQKTQLFPGKSFIVGYDTAARILEARYYGGSDSLFQALEKILEFGCRFLVAGRKAGNEFQTLGNLLIPGRYKELFREIPSQIFRSDLSSTEIRKHQEEF